MAGFSNYLESAVLNWIRGTAMPTAPSAVYVGLFSSDPTDVNSGTEVTTTIRAGGRVAATFGAPTTNTGANVIANTGIVDFGNAAGAATVTHFGVFDAASSGNLLGAGTVSGGGAIGSGVAVSFAVGALTLSLD